MSLRKLSKKENGLVRRYLIWCYKTTKEDLDRVERYFTQHEVDKFLLGELRKAKEGAEHLVFIDKFEQYLHEKKAKADQKKFLDGQSGPFTPGYHYLKLRFEAIEGAITHFLGAKELKLIHQAYENEMTRRIIEAREHT